MSVNDYSTDPGSNTSINGINVAEGCAPANINNAIRQMMADIADGVVQFYAQTKNATQQLRARQNIGLGQVNNTSDANKPISTATQNALNGKVNNNDGRLTNAREWTAATVSPAEAQAGTSNVRRAWTAERVRQAFNASGAAPVYACRAWVTFFGGGGVQAHGNVSSVERLGPGRYRINFSTPMQDRNYAVTGAAGVRILVVPEASRHPGSVVVETRLLGGTIDPADADFVSVAIHR